MKRIPTFVAGMLTAAVIGGLGVGALAASGAVSFNASNIQLNGQQISAKGENYTLPSGQQVPASITYTDETGGGTTYLPVRRIAVLLGVEIGWDNASGSVTVTGDVKPAETTPNPDTTAASTDYSDWTAEEEAAYQEFKAMWEVEFTKKDDVTYHMNGSFDNTPWEMYKLTYNGTLSCEEVENILHHEQTHNFLRRFAYETGSPNTRIDFNICYSDGGTFGFYSFK